MITLTASHCPIDFSAAAELAKPVSAIATIRQDSLKKPVMLGLERDPSVYSTLVEFGIIDDKDQITH